MTRAEIAVRLLAAYIQHYGAISDGSVTDAVRRADFLLAELERTKPPLSTNTFVPRPF